MKPNRTRQPLTPRMPKPPAKIDKQAEADRVAKALGPDAPMTLGRAFLEAGTNSIEHLKWARRFNQWLFDATASLPSRRLQRLLIDAPDLPAEMRPNIPAGSRMFHGGNVTEEALAAALEVKKALAKLCRAVETARPLARRLPAPSSSSRAATEAAIAALGGAVTPRLLLAASRLTNMDLGGAPTSEEGWKKARARVVRRARRGGTTLG